MPFRRAMTLPLVCLAVACSSGSEPESQSGEKPAEVAGQFARAWTKDDQAAISHLLCPGVPGPPKIGAGPSGPSLPPISGPGSGGELKGARVIGPVAEGPSTGGIIVVEGVDFHVPVGGTQGGRTVEGAIEITMGQDEGKPCVHLYGFAPNAGV